jgi:HEAT repeat protein
MIPQPRHYYRPGHGDRVAEVSAQPAADRQAWTVAVRRGPNARGLRPTALYGPYAEEQLAAPFEQAAGDLRAEGFVLAGTPALLEALDSPNPARRALAALRLGWRRSPEAVDKLLELLPQSVAESCSLLDALGAIGDARAIPALREYAGRKLLSRRRSAVEALRQLGDAEGLGEAELRARERLPAVVLATLDAGPADLAQAILGLEPAPQGLALDTLYELASPAAVAAVTQVIAQAGFAQPHLWRAAKSIFKRSLLRHDHETFGRLIHAIESQGRGNKGTTAAVKSGYDGQPRTTVLFGRKTQDYLRCRAWRYLRDLARYLPESYAGAAAECLIHYTPDEVAAASQRCYLLHRILWGRSERFTFEARKMICRPRGRKLAAPPTGVREEAYPELWDARPRAYLRVLTASPLPEAHGFALRGLAEHPMVLEEASHAQVVALLQAPYEPTVQLGLRELERRFHPDQPDWPLLLQLLNDERALARALGQRWLRLTAHLWLRAPERILAFLAVGNANLRAFVVELTAGALADQPALRQELARQMVALLRGAELTADTQDGCLQLTREMLAAEVSGLVSVAELADWIGRGTPTLQMLAGHLLRGRPEAVDALGLERLTALAQHEVAVVRRAAHALLRAAVASLRADPSPLFVLVESDWEDTRCLASELLREHVKGTALGLDGLLGLLDSNRPDVQEVGRELAVQHAAELPLAELATRLAQHPDPGMRRFALELLARHLPHEQQALVPLQSFCRAALLDLWPDRRVKRAVIDLVAARGLEGPGQAATAAAILGDMVRLQGRADFERALEALVRLKLAFPDLQTTVRLPAGGEA